MPLIEQRGLTLIGVAICNLEDDRAVQLALPFDRQSGSDLDAAVDEVRERFGSAAVTRAVLLGREPAPPCRSCPTGRAPVRVRVSDMKVFVVPLAVLLVLASATACGEDEAGSPTPESLQDVPWVLASGVDVEGWEKVAPSATFMDGSVTGSTGCNRFTAPYTLDGGPLEIGQIASTRMACAPPADTVEREYVAALGQVKAWRSENDELTLLDGDDNDVLGYRVGTPAGSWQVTGIRQGDAIVSPIAETEITASFAEDGTLSGSAGCNTYTAAYTTNKGEIEITDPTDEEGMHGARGDHAAGGGVSRRTSHGGELSGFSWFTRAADR